MIAFPAGVKVWIAGGVTDMRRGMNTLALQVQEGHGRDPRAGELFCFRGRKGDRIVKMGEDITKTLEVIPRQWKVIQTVRDKFTCRACEKISQPPAPFHAIPRGWAGPSLIGLLVFESEPLSALVRGQWRAVSTSL